MVTGSWLMAHGSRLMAHASRLVARGGWPRKTWRWVPQTRALCISLGRVYFLWPSFSNQGAFCRRLLLASPAAIQEPAFGCRHEERLRVATSLRGILLDDAMKLIINYCVMKTFCE
jgi:hypothetical protein